MRHIGRVTRMPATAGRKLIGEIGFHGWVCTPVPQRMELSSDSEGEIKNVGQNSDLLSEALE